MDDDGEVLACLRRIEGLLHVLAKSQLRATMEQEFSDPKMRQVYALTETLSARELGKKMKWSRMKISRIWQRWEELGLVIKDGSQYRRTL